MFANVSFSSTMTACKPAIFASASSPAAFWSVSILATLAAICFPPSSIVCCSRFILPSFSSLNSSNILFPCSLISFSLFFPASFSWSTLILQLSIVSCSSFFVCLRSSSFPDMVVLCPSTLTTTSSLSSVTFPSSSLSLSCKLATMPSCFSSSVFNIWTSVESFAPTSPPFKLSVFKASICSFWSFFSATSFSTVSFFSSSSPFNALFSSSSWLSTVDFAAATLCNSTFISLTFSSSSFPSSSALSFMSSLSASKTAQCLTWLFMSA